MRRNGEADAEAGRRDRSSFIRVAAAATFSITSSEMSKFACTFCTSSCSSKDFHELEHLLGAFFFQLDRVLRNVGDLRQGRYRSSHRRALS